MNQFESRHYIFHFGEATKAERDIESIAAYQESCFQHICAVLGVTPEFKIEYYLCDSPEEVGRIYGDNDPCNGFASPPNKVYAVYNEHIQCIGFHEDAHLISYVITALTVRPYAKDWQCISIGNGGEFRIWIGSVSI